MLTNTEAMGYMIMAAKDLGLKKETIKNLENAMRENMNTYTEVFADSEYERFK